MIAYQLRVTPSASEDFLALRAYDQARLRDAIAAQLTYEPTTATKHRKRLRTNPIATWELRVGNWRVMYEVDDALGEVVIMAIGRKIHDTLVIRGEEHDL